MKIIVLLIKIEIENGIFFNIPEDMKFSEKLLLIKW